MKSSLSSDHLCRAAFVERLQQRFTNDKRVRIAYLYIEDIYSSPCCSVTISTLLGSICRQILRFPLDDGPVRSYNQHQKIDVRGQASKSQVLYALQQSVANYSRVMVVITWFVSESAISPSRPLFPIFHPINFDTRFLNYYK
jgi:hypothetical protein